MRPSFSRPSRCQRMKPSASAASSWASSSPSAYPCRSGATPEASSWQTSCSIYAGGSASLDHGPTNHPRAQGKIRTCPGYDDRYAYHKRTSIYTCILLHHQAHPLSPVQTHRDICCWVQGCRIPLRRTGCHNVEFEHIVQDQPPPSTLYEPCARYKTPRRRGKNHVAQRRCLFRPPPRWLQCLERGRRCNICSISTLWRFPPCKRYLQGCGGARHLHNGGVLSTRDVWSSTRCL